MAHKADQARQQGLEGFGKFSGIRLGTVWVAGFIAAGSS